MSTISKSINRIDAPEKIRGEAKYLSDYKIDNVLYAKTLRSTIPRGEIISIEYPNIPEGYYIINKDDVPGKNIVKIIHDDMPFFADKVVNYIGDPILLVVGPCKEKILNIIKNIKVTYKEIDAIYTIEEALENKKKPIFKNNNIVAEYTIEKGNVNEAFKNAYKTFEGEYETGYQEHVYLETQSVLGIYENENIKVIGSMQCPYYVKNALIQGLGMDEDRVQVIQSTTGGAFGGKEEYPSLIAGQVAIAALKCKAPVLLILDRNEDIEFTTKRHPSKIRIKGAIDNNFRLIGLQSEILLDGGAYAGLSQVILQRAMFVSTGVYNVENHHVSGKVVCTNNVIGGAYRGFGAPQAVFALETFINKICRELNIDNTEFKKINFLKQGDATCTSGIFREPVPLNEMMQRLKELSSYDEKVKSYSKEKLKGIGIAMFYHGCGFTGSGERDHIKAVVKLKKNYDNSVDILISNVEMGQGTKTTLRKIVAKALDIDISKVNYENPDTKVVPDSGPTVASRTIMVVGKLLKEASEKIKKRWFLEKEFEEVVKYTHPEEFKWDDDTLTGDAYVAYSWGGNAIEVEIDPLTYEVETKGVWSVYDIGIPIDEKIVYGQIDGGVMQALGYASLEVMEGKNGKLKQKTNTDYIIPTFMDFKNMERELILNPSEQGPYGAKGLGEVSFVGIPAAYALAVENALGKSVNKLPITPEYVMEVYKNE